GYVLIREPVTPGLFVTARASEVQAGQIVAEAGREIRAAEMSVLASFGYKAVTVGGQPRVSVFATGSELIGVGEKPAGAQIRNSNSFTIAAYSERAGARAGVKGVICDSVDATLQALMRAADSSDVVITSGGVSVGDYDLVKTALIEMGAEIFFDQVSIRPGKPTVFARLGATYFFGLPGNPVSTSVTFNVFVRPALRKMMGDTSPSLPVLRASASRNINDGSDRRSYLPARFFVSEGRAMAEPLKWGGSSDLVAFMQANAMIVVPEDTHHIAEGEIVEVMLLSSV
ncbi:MAG TPA: molybdopterin molybdotransferase MoeA, partial [Blastocatellia bacterium]